eukprot:SAG31_NODE_9331_length_1295_cov_1.971572_3_plen_41_part_01
MRAGARVLVTSVEDPGQADLLCLVGVEAGCNDNDGSEDESW